MNGIVSLLPPATIFVQAFAKCTCPRLCYAASYRPRRIIYLQHGLPFFVQRSHANDSMNPTEMKKTLTGHLESIVAQQMQEMEMVRQKVFSLEQAQLNMKQRYDNVSNPIGESRRR